MKSEQINNHQVFQVIQNIINRLSQNDTNQIQSEHRETILDALSYIESKIKNSIHSLVFEDTLTQIQNSLQFSMNELNNFFGNKNYGHVYNSLSNLKNAVHLTAQLPTCQVSPGC